VSVDLPRDLVTAIKGLLDGKSRRDLARHATAISENYRQRAGTDRAVRSAPDALAYVLVRMPATYAAVSAAFAALAERMPHFAPSSLLNFGAYPGTASWAAAARWPTLTSIAMVKRNRPLIDIGHALRASSTTPALRAARHVDGNLPRAKLVVAS